MLRGLLFAPWAKTDSLYNYITRHGGQKEMCFYFDAIKSRFPNISESAFFNYLSAPMELHYSTPLPDLMIDMCPGQIDLILYH